MCNFIHDGRIDQEINCVISPSDGRIDSTILKYVRFKFTRVKHGHVFKGKKGGVLLKVAVN